MSKTYLQLEYSPDELDKKDTRLKREIFSLSFEYMLAGIAEEYKAALAEEGKVIDTLEDFNKYNTLGLSRVVVYPFFVAISNGYSNSLYNLFGEFKSFNFGPGSVSVYEMLRYNSAEASDYPALHFFNIDFYKNPGKTEVIHPAAGRTFSDIKRDILAVRLCESDHKFEEVKIASDAGNYKELYAAINAGISKLQHLTNEQFFKYNESEMLFRAKKIKTFNAGYFLHEAKTLRYKEVKSEKERAFN